MKKRWNRDYEVSAQSEREKRHKDCDEATTERRRTISYRITRKNFTTENQRQTKPISTHHRVDLSVPLCVASCSISVARKTAHWTTRFAGNRSRSTGWRSTWESHKTHIGIRRTRINTTQRLRSNDSFIIRQISIPHLYTCSRYTSKIYA